MTIDPFFAPADILSCVAIGFYAVCQDKVVYVNPGCAKLTGYSEAELNLDAPFSFVCSDDRALLEEAIRKATENEPAEPLDLRLITKSGETIWVQACLVSLPHKGQKAVLASLTDITVRRRREQEGRVSEERYRSIIENIQDGYIEVGLDGRWTFFNDVICQHMQYSREELTGMDFHQMHTPQSARNTVKAFAQVYQTGNPAKSIEIEGVRKDGSIGYYELSVSPIKNAKGQTTGFRCISRDITERIKMESALRLSEERYRTIIDEMQEWYFESDSNGNLLFFNEAIARALGRQPDELAGAHFRDLIETQEADKIYNAFHRVYVTAEPVRNVPYRFATPDGAEMLSEFSIFPKRDEMGRVVGFRAVGHDITQKKKMEHQQMLSEKMATIGQLAAGAAQKINHPIFFIESNLKTIAEYLDDVAQLFSLTKNLAGEALDPARPDAPTLVTRLAEIQEMAQKLKMDFVLDDLQSLVSESQDSVEQIIRIVRDLETYGQKDDDPPKPANLNDLLEASLNSVWKELKYKARVVRDYADLPPVVCRPLQLQQVFSNLLVNAAQAIADEGEIRLSTRREGDHVVAISIADTGSGIPEETLSRIFDPFFTTKDSEKSTGLGLHVAFSLIERHSGKIEVESKPSAGTTFTILLPI